MWKFWIRSHRRGLVGTDVTIHLDGGTIHIRLAEDGIWMTGPTAHVFDGWLSPAFLAAHA